MTVAELIAELKKLPPDDIVLVGALDGNGYDDVMLPFYTDNVSYVGYRWPAGKYASGSVRGARVSTVLKAHILSR
jgi:hypothetical protein